MIRYLRRDYIAILIELHVEIKLLHLYGLNFFFKNYLL
jgi:hypothetical protein